ncbi:hypothetical protein [Alkalibacillus aidingensis]|uniref:hypothetical protein n=1 Tax=Alkalibacillus aidingensis TaxID=2747607 RepID=UPI0016605E71|nr:hypothetical protein [Alkalibacillus aidingensis]
MSKFHHFSSRIASAFITFLLSYIVYLVYTGFHLSEAYNLFSNPLIWGIFVFYLVISSYIVEWVAVKLEDESKRMFVSLYMLAGMIVWFVTYIPVLADSIMWYIYMVLYSSIFTVVAFIIFYPIERFTRKTRKRPFYMGFPAILILSIILIWNPSIKQGFADEYEDNRYTAKFERFNGEELVDIPVEADHNYEIVVDWDISDGGPYGLKMHPDSSGLGTMDFIGDEDEWRYQFEAEKSGDLPIIFHGKDIEGSVEFTWTNVTEG